MPPITRRAFIRSAAAAAAALPATRGWAAGERPNIVVILADDMGYGDVGCLNPESKIPTPNLDRLAAQGVTCTDAHSPSAVCTPTRYSLLTGDYCWRSPLQASVLWPWDGPLIPRDKLTLPGMLKAQGYDTACIGKWHLGWTWPTRDGSSVNEHVALGERNNEVRDAFGWKVDYNQPIDDGPVTRGFDYYFGDDVPNFAPYCYIENDRVVEEPTIPKPDGMFGTAGPMVEGWDLAAVMPALTERAVDYIRAKPGAAPYHRAADAPFFLYFPLTAPHTPIAPAPDFVGTSGAHRYGDFVAQVDWTVGQIMLALEESGQSENTLLIFSSDNGSPARDGENMNGAPRSVSVYGHNPSHVFRGIKTDVWDGGHRVPFFARWPGRIPAGTTSRELMCLVDLMATCAAITGYPLRDDTAVDSYDILPALAGRELAEPVREALVHHSYHGLFAIRQGPWKLIAGRGGGGWDAETDPDSPPGQLYHMGDDIGEANNRYRERPDVVARLEGLLAQYRKSGRSVVRR